MKNKNENSRIRDNSNPHETRSTDMDTGNNLQNRKNETQHINDKQDVENEGSVSRAADRSGNVADRVRRNSSERLKGSSGLTDTGPVADYNQDREI